jgi:hypothetical protein
LAKTVICAKTGCLASGPEAVFGNITLQITETIALAPKPRPTAVRQEKSTTRQQLKPERSIAHQPPRRQEASEKPPVREIKEPQKAVDEFKEARREETSWEKLVSLLVEEARVERTKAEAVLNAIVNYLTSYPSVGVLRLVDDVTRISKTDQKTVRAALEILRSSDVVEIKEEGVVNLRQAIKRGELPL